MSKTATAQERVHMGILKKEPCACCGNPNGVQVHHIVNGYRLGHFYTLPLCVPCHEHIKDKTDQNNLIRQLVIRKQLYAKLNLYCPPYQSKLPYLNKLMAEAGVL